MSKFLAPFALSVALLQSPAVGAQEGGTYAIKDLTQDVASEAMKNVEGIDIVPLDEFAGLSPEEKDIELRARKAFNTVRPPVEVLAKKSKGYTEDGLRILPEGLSLEQSVSYNARLSEQKATENKRQRVLESRYEAGDTSVKIVGRTVSGDMLYEVEHTPKPIFHMGVSENKKFGVGVQPTLQLGTETLQLGVSGTISKDQKNALIALGWQFSPSGVITLSASTGAENAQKAFAEQALDGDKNLKARTFGIRLDLAGIGPIARTRLEVLHTEVPSMFLGQTSKDTVRIRIEDLPTVINTLKDTTTTTTHYSSEKATHTTARLGGVIEVGESGELSLSLGAVSSHIGAESSVHPSGTLGYTYYGGVDKFEIGARYTGHSTGIDAKYTRKISEGISAFVGGFADKGTNGYSNSGVMIGLSATFGGPDNPIPYVRPDSTHPHVEHVVSEVLADTQYRAQDIASLTHLHKEVEVHTHTTTLSSVSKILSLSVANETASTPHNTPVTLNLLANDTTPNAGGVLAIIGTPTVTNGTLTMSGGSVTVTPTLGFVGNMVVSYTVGDGLAANITETATISVAAPINQAPTANPDAITTEANTSVSFNPLTNDTDPENNILSLVSATSSNGTISTSGNTVTFTPNNGFVGTANILYTITDGIHQVTGNAQVTVNAPVNQAPNAFPAIAPISATAGTAGSSILSGTTDPDGDTLTYSVSSLPTGFSFDAASRTLSWSTSTTPGAYSFTLQAVDGNGGTTQRTVSVTVTAPADVLAPSQTNSTNLGSFTLGNTLTRTLTFDEAISTAIVSGLPAGVSATTNISGNSVTVTLSVDPLVYSFASATDTISFTLTVGDGAPTSNTRAISESAQVADVAPTFVAQSDATRDDDGGFNPIIPVTDICPTGVDSFGRTIISCIVNVVNPPHNEVGLSYNPATNAIEGTIDIGISPIHANVERIIRLQGGGIPQITNSVINLVNNG